ncbi:MAG TPA: hypothetical protein VKV26_23805 [Dehalococcoidia bacterium]|nr:hypothetical protein [Dehalococcoidia bacterium]
MPDDVCIVCAEPLTENRATCNQCGADFHFALRIDVPAKDCGDAWIDDEVQALVFGCNRCLGRMEPAGERRRYARREQTGARAVARARRGRRAREARGDDAS